MSTDKARRDALQILRSDEHCDDFRTPEELGISRNLLDYLVDEGEIERRGNTYRTLDS